MVHHGVYIFSNFGFRLNRLAFNDTKTHFYISKVALRFKKITFEVPIL